MTKLNFKRSIAIAVLTVIVSFCAIFALVSLGSSNVNSALASETHTHGDNDNNIWSTFDSSTNTTLSGSGQNNTVYYYLSSDVTLTTNITISSGTVYLCLNGNVLTGASKYTSSTSSDAYNNSSKEYDTDSIPTSAVITVSSGAILYLCDCNTTTTHKYYVDSSTGAYVFCDSTCGSHTHNTITGGVITGGEGTARQVEVSSGDSKSYMVTYRGGGIYVSGTVYMSGGTIAGNSLGGASGTSDDGYGAGVYIEGGTFTMTDGSIEGNAALGSGGSGGGVRVQGNGVFYLKGGTIKNNTATSSGGGVNVQNGTLNMSDGTITGNTAKQGGGGGAVYIATNSSGSGTQVGGTFNFSGGYIYGNSTNNESLNDIYISNSNAYGGVFAMTGGYLDATVGLSDSSDNETKHIIDGATIETNHITISGGYLSSTTYSSILSNNTPQYIADGYIVVQLTDSNKYGDDKAYNSDYPYAVYKDGTQVASITREYDGTNNYISLPDGVSASYTYVDENNSQSEGSDLPVNVGSYTVTPTFTITDSNGNTVSAYMYTVDGVKTFYYTSSSDGTSGWTPGYTYNPKTTFNVTILPADIQSISWYYSGNDTSSTTISGDSASVEYSGKTWTVTATATGVSSETFTVYLKVTLNGDTATIQNAGEYKVEVVSITGNGSESAYNYTIGSYKGSYITFTVEKADATVTALTAKTNLVYNGTAQALVNAGSTEDGTILYALSEEGEYSDTIPTGTNADTYTVYYYVEGDDNHNDSSVQSINVTIYAKKLTVVWAVDGNDVKGYSSTVEYKGSAYEVTAKATDENDSEVENVLTQTSFWGTNADTYEFTASVSCTNYIISKGSENFKLTIKPYEITSITWAYCDGNGTEGSFADGKANVTYNGNTWTITAKATGVNGDDTLTLLTGTAKDYKEGGYTFTITTLPEKYATNYQLAEGVTTSVTFCIEQVELTVSWSYTYTDSNSETQTETITNGSASVPYGFTYTVTATASGMVPGESVTLTVTDGSGLTEIKSYSLKASIESGTYSSNYKLSDSGITFTIVEAKTGYGSISFDEYEKTLTYGDLVAITATYIKGDSQEVTGGTITYSSSDTTVAIVDGETGKVKLLKAGTFTITATWKCDGYDDLTATTCEITVNKKSLTVEWTVTADSVGVELGDNSYSYTTTYNGTTYTVSASVTTNVIGDDLTNALTFGDNVTLSFKDVTEQSIIAELTSSWKDKYELDSSSTTFTIKIEAKELTVEWSIKQDETSLGGNTVTYNGNAWVISASAEGVYGEMVTITVAINDGDSSESVSVTNADSYKITATIASVTNGLASNYTLTNNEITFVINKAKLTAPTEDTKTYTYTGSEITYRPSGFDDSTMSISGNVQVNANESGYTVIVSLNDTANYQWSDGSVADITFTFVIKKATLTVTADDMTVTYGDDAPTYTITYSGWKGSDSVDNYTFTTAPEASSNYIKGTTGVDSLTITVSGGEDTNYTFEYVSGTLTVSQRAITVTIDSKTSVYGEDIAELTATVTEGLVNGDSASDVYVLSTNATSSSNVGAYDITGESINDNYDITFVKGTYEITAATMSVSVTGYSGTYDGKEHAAATSYSATTVDNTSATWQFSLDDENYSSDMPTVTNAGEYTLYYKVTAANHEAVEGSVTVTVSKAKVEVLPQVPEDWSGEIDEDEEIGTIDPPDGWKWKNPEEVPVADEDGKAKVEIVIEVDDDNYDWTGVDGYNEEDGTYTVEIEVTVTPAETPAEDEVTGGDELVTPDEEAEDDQTDSRRVLFGWLAVLLAALIIGQLIVVAILVYKRRDEE